MIELLSPAGSPEGVIAAVQNGADAVYMGMGAFNARRGAKNFTDEEFVKAVRYCHVSGGCLRHRRRRPPRRRGFRSRRRRGSALRSEEHTSELQSH